MFGPSAEVRSTLKDAALLSPVNSHLENDNTGRSVGKAGGLTHQLVIADQEKNSVRIPSAGMTDDCGATSDLVRGKDYRDRGWLLAHLFRDRCIVGAAHTRGYVRRG